MLCLSFVCFSENAVKDVSNRYASSWMSKTRKLRIDSDWWEDTLQPYKSRNKVQYLKLIQLQCNICSTTQIVSVTTSVLHCVRWQTLSSDIQDISFSLLDSLIYHLSDTCTLCKSLLLSNLDRWNTLWDVRRGIDI